VLTTVQARGQGDTVCAKNSNRGRTANRERRDRIDDLIHARRCFAFYTLRQRALIHVSDGITVKPHRFHPDFFVMPGPCARNWQPV
jgi:hypothetical protein